MKTILAYILYYIGHVISLTLLRVNILSHVGYPMYRWFMIWSSDLDTKQKIWKEPTEGEDYYETENTD